MPCSIGWRQRAELKSISPMTIYLDCNATTLIDPRVAAEIGRCFSEEWATPAVSMSSGRAKQLSIPLVNASLAC